MVRLLKLFSLVGVLALFAGVVPTHATLLGPTPYLSAADSPWASTSFSYFHLEDFEDGLLNTPGVTAFHPTSLSISSPGGFTDSVDADDGVIDGSGAGGHSLFSSGGATAITFTFDELVLGVLPTHAGLVWTDGSNDVVFEVFDSLGSLIGTSGPQTIAGAGFNGLTNEDRFFGFEHAGGIGSISIRHTFADFNVGIEVDHLQYGSAEAISEPGALAVFGVGLAGLIAIRRRSKQRS